MGILDLFKKKKTKPVKTVVENSGVVSEEPSFAAKVKTELAVYELIVQALDEDGNLPGEFSLPVRDTKEQMRFAPGAMDGIRVYHMQRPSSNEAAIQVLELLIQLANHRTDENLARLAAYLTEHSVLSIANELTPLLYQRQSHFSPQMAMEIGYSLMVTGTEIELVKLGIVLTGLLNVERNETYRDVLLLLGRYDEFTLFVLVAIARWEHCNQITFQLAQSLTGWGKIHAVERLEPDSEEIKNWILCYGCQNNVVDAYLGLVCATKGDMLGTLKNDVIDAEQLQGISIIFNALLEEGPVPGISRYENVKEAIEYYLFHVEQQTLTLETADTLLRLAAWIEQSELKAKPILRNRCLSVVAPEMMKDLILKVLAGDERDRIWLACDLAEQLSIDIKVPLLQRMQEDPLQYVGTSRLLCQDPAYAKEVFGLYENYLPLPEIATGMGDLLGLGKEYKYHSCLDLLLVELKGYPNQGIELVKTGLQSPVVRNRSLASETILEWMHISETEVEPDAGVINLVHQILKAEVNDSVKEKLQKIANS